MLNKWTWNGSLWHTLLVRLDHLESKRSRCLLFLVKYLNKYWLNDSLQYYWKVHTDSRMAILAHIVRNTKRAHSLMWKPEKFILKSCIFSFCLSKLQTDICSWTLCHRHPLVTLSGSSAILPFIMLIHLLLCLMCLGITQCLKYKTVDGNKLLINNLKPTHGVKVHVVVQWSSLIEKSSIACLLDLHKHCSSLHGCFLLHYHWCQRFLNR